MTRRLASLLIMACCLIFSLSAQVQAKDLFGPGVCTGAGAGSSAVCTDNAKTDPNQDPISGKDGLLSKLTDIVAFVGGAAAIIMIIIGALRYITAGGDISTGARDDNDVRDAKRTISNALIGLIVIVLARQIILFVLHKL